MEKTAKLAIDGGTPVRAAMEAGMLRGAYLIGEEEAERVAAVVQSRSPFRYYGPDCQYAVRSLEEMMAKELKSSP